jgi:hypothetical protein
MFEVFCTIAAVFGAVVVFVFVCADYMPDWMRM